jgi:hypothetical protein
MAPAQLQQCRSRKHAGTIRTDGTAVAAELPLNAVSRGRATPPVSAVNAQVIDLSPTP